MCLRLSGSELDWHLTRLASGANLVRPGLETLRDLAAEGQIRAALVYSPDRLSRKYAYQVLLTEELSRCGVELVFLKAPAGASPEDHCWCSSRA